MLMTETMSYQGLEFDAEKRRYYDTVTWLAEVLPGSMRTPSEYRFDGHELYAEDNSALEPIFLDSIEQSKVLPDYEQRRRRVEYEEYQDMLAMARGELPNTMVVVSDFPPELMNAARDVGGYNVARKQTMLRVITRSGDGGLKMYSQSLDGSDRKALESIYEFLGFNARHGELLSQRMHTDIGEHEQEFLVDQLMGVYDRNLQAQYGGNWFAGQYNMQPVNTYEFVCQQQDLINAYLATTTRFTGGFRDYSLAAALKERFLNRGRTIDMQHGFIPVAAHSMALMEMNGAGNRAQARGETFSGCGSTLGSSGSSSAESQLDSLGYGNQADKPESGSEKLVWKDGICRIDKCPTRPGKTKVAQCSVCKTCQGWFDRGKDPNRIYKTAGDTTFRSIIENSFGRQDELRKEEARANAWLN